MSGRILVVDDEPVVLEVLSEVLSREGYQVSQAAHATSALERLELEPHELVLCDIRMPGMDGFELLHQITRSHPGTDVILMTGYGSLDGAVEAMCLGAADYLIKPLRPKEVLARIRSILERRRLERELQLLQGELRSRHDLQNVVAVSPRMTAVVSAVRRIASREEPVVLIGEPGSGRSFLARAIHYASPRRDQAFATLTCDGGACEDLALEIFGRRISERRVQRGQLERLQAGTFHLLEVQLLSESLQELLGRCLKTRSYSMLADGEVQELRARLIISLGAPLSDSLANGRLHPELKVLESLVSIHVPPLRERVEDVPGLVSNFVSTYEAEHGHGLEVEPEAIETLKRASYPGNVGQLFGLLEHCATMSAGGVLTAEVITRGLRQAGPSPAAPWAPMAEHLGDRERLLVMRAVDRHPGRLDQAARELGISRTTLWRRMRKYGIRA